MSHAYYFGAMFASMILYLFASILLFMRRNEGERSRLLLSCLMFASVVNYLSRIFQFTDTVSSIEVIPIRHLLLGVFVVTIYVMYPIEVISPGWLTWKRIAYISLPLMLLLSLFMLSKVCGVEYNSYSSMSELIGQIGLFEVQFRLFLIFMIFIPVLLLYLVPYTRRYNNTDRRWIGGYVLTVLINTIAYLLVIMQNVLIFRLLYYVVSVSCGFYIFYQEMFVRLIKKKEDHLFDPIVIEEEVEEVEVGISDYLKEKVLFRRIEEYVEQREAWRDPDLSLTILVKHVYSNRTSLLQALQSNGYKGYSSYINQKRIQEFIRLIESGAGNYQDVFFDVGFRSRAKALRNFKEITGKSPSDYFIKNSSIEP